MGQLVLHVLLLFHLFLHPSQVSGESGIVQEVRVDADIRHRYAITLVSTTLYNPRPYASTLQLDLSLPPTALLSGLVVEVDGRNYSGRVYDRSGANALFQETTRQGKTVASLHHGDEEIQRVKVQTSVAGMHSITFHATYEDLLRRIDGTYQYTLPVYPGEHVPRVEISVHVIEQEDIKDYWVRELPGQEMTSPSYSTSVTGGPTNPRELHITYLHQDLPQGPIRRINGSFTLAYTTVKNLDGGEIQREGSFFAHYFSPEPMSPLRTHTVYVLDVSHSMRKTRLPELQGALSAALHSIHRDDSFEILVFSSDVVSLGTYSGKPREVRRAVKRVMRLEALGDSNLCSALLQALKNAASHRGKQIYKQIVVFTDGQINSGETDLETIQKKVTEANGERIPIISFIFRDGSTKLLQRISSNNQGFIRVAQPSSSLAKQIQAFLWTVVRPLVAGVEAQYPGVVPESLVRSGTENYYYGSELILAGKLLGGPHHFQPILTGLVERNMKEFPVTRIVSHTSRASQDTAHVSIISRLWAYLKLQELLAKAESSLSDELTDRLHTQACDLAQQFSFVTRLTSLVAVYPDASVLLTQPNEIRSISYVPSSQGPSQLVAAAYTGSRRSGRSYMHDNRPQTFVDLAPHFLVRAEGVELPLCFYLHTDGDAFISLIRDPLSGMIINGHKASLPNRPFMTYFNELFVSVGGINVTISTDRIRVDCLADDGTTQVQSITKSLWPYYKRSGRRYKYREDRSIKRKKGRRTKKQMINNLTHKFSKNSSSYNKYNAPHNPSATQRVEVDDDIYNCHRSTTWREGISLIYGDLMIVMSSRKHLQLTLGDGLADLRVVLSGNRRYLGFHMKRQQILSSETHGIIGHLMSKNMRLLSGRQPTGESSSSQRVQVEVRNGNNSRGPGEAVLPGVIIHRASLLNSTSNRCININPRYTPLLPSSPADYVLECLTC